MNINTKNFFTKYQHIRITSDIDMKNLYLNAYIITQGILDEVLKNHYSEVTAIDIRYLVKAFNIEIVETKMKLSTELFQYGTPGYLDNYGYKGNERLWTMYINESMGDLSKRYIIAYEFAHYLLINLSQESKDNKIECCTNPLFPKKTIEQLCDLLATFLLMPLKTVLRLMDNYVKKCQEENSGPIDMYDWLHYLGCKMGVSDYHTVLCFQHVRYLGGIIHEIQQQDPNCERFNKEFYAEIKQFYTELFK